jgi:hypothetical protein
VPTIQGNAVDGGHGVKDAFAHPTNCGVRLGIEFIFDLPQPSRAR